MQKTRKITALILALCFAVSLCPAVLASADDSGSIGAVKTGQTILVDGQSVSLAGYSVEDYNYFALRDLAAVLNGTASQYSVELNESENAVYITTGQGYDGESAAQSADEVVSCEESSWSFYVNGVEAEVSSYNINGNNYFKLRDLANAIGFGVGYDAAANSVIIASGAIVIDGAAEGDYSGNVTVAAGGVWTVTDNQQVASLTVEGSITADYPVIVFYSDSASVSNGQLLNNVQYVSDYDEVIAIVHTNDTHGFIQNEAYVKGFADQVKASGKYDMVTTINAGDVWGGGYVAAHGYEGELIPALMSQVYDIMVPGNADVSLTNTYYSTALLAALGESQGLKCLLANQVINVENFDMAEFAESYEVSVGNELLTELYPVLSLNDDGSIDWSGLQLENYSGTMGEYPLDQTMTITTPGGTQIGLYGMDWFGRGGAWTGLGSIETSQNCANLLREQGCTAVIGIIHTGYPDGDETLMAVSSNDTNSAQIALNTSGIDVLIDAHTHTIINDGNGIIFGDSNTYINQAYAYGEAIGLMELYICDGEIIAKSGELVTDFSDITPDAEVREYVDFVYNKLDEDGYMTILATSDVFLNAERSSANNVGGGVRLNETNLGDLVADGLLTIANELSDEGYDIAMYPGYWVRASIEPGNITKAEITSVFANTTAVYTKVLTAETLVEKMQSSIELVGIAENNNFIQISGFTVTYTPGTEANELYSITVGDTVVYENGQILVGDDWTCRCAYTLVNADDRSLWDINDMIIADKATLADLFCQYLLNYDEVIYDNVIAPDSRVTAHE
ncbi:MAG: 5'-nucleotidase C-terminal domain-containing protein [Oscillospiraceae bacterium]|nr:5'-nucleotidase C-terminal domain-containing protein [Oscillospiraceae bacterium]